MGSIIKGNRYRLVDNHSFELPLPMKYELYKEDSPVAEYEIADDEKVSCRIITKHKEEMLTPVNRQLLIADIYFFLSSRVFQDNTPFTRSELLMVGLEKYNVMDIVRKTRGITPFDNYWLKFEGDTFDYEKALNNFNEIFPAYVPAPAEPQPVPTEAPAEVRFEPAPAPTPAPAPVEKSPEPTPAPAAPAEEESLKNNVMSADEIEALLMKTGLTEKMSAFDEPVTEPEAAESGGKMSQDDIEKLLAAAQAPEAAPAEPEPAPAPATGGKMSQDDIEKLLAAAQAPEAAPAEPEPATAPATGGKMSQDDIEKLLAAAQAPEAAPAEPEPAPASGGKMSQDDIEKLLAAAQAPEAAPAEPEPATAPASGGKMSQDDIEKLLSGMQDDARK